MKKINGMIENRELETSRLEEVIGQKARLHGSVYRIRRMSGFAFVILRTREQLVQCVYEEGKVNLPLEELMEEACVEVLANVVEEPRSRTGWELHLEEITVLSSPAQKMPVIINHKTVDTSLENLLDYRPITLRNEKERAIFRIQEGICRGIRQYLHSEGFTEIHTPKLVFAGAEGGANIFKLDYFGREAFLAQSPQFYKQMMVGVYERVFEIAPVFRAEKFDTSRHLNEYTSVDFEMGYLKSFEEIMQMETGMLRHVMELLEAEYAYEVNLLAVSLPKITEIPAMPFLEAKEWVAKEFGRAITDYEDFEPEEERLLGKLAQEKLGSEFLFVTHYPSTKRPFYAMDTKENPQVTDSFDLLFRGMEVTTGGQRIHSYEEQVAKMQNRGMDIGSFESFLMMHKYGMPPHGGLGLGLERLTARLLNQENVRRTTLFPRDVHRLTP